MAVIFNPNASRMPWPRPKPLSPLPATRTVPPRPGLGLGIGGVDDMVPGAIAPGTVGGGLMPQVADPMADREDEAPGVPAQTGASAGGLMSFNPEPYGGISGRQHAGLMLQALSQGLGQMATGRPVNIDTSRQAAYLHKMGQEAHQRAQRKAYIDQVAQTNPAAAEQMRLASTMPDFYKIQAQIQRDAIKAQQGTTAYRNLVAAGYEPGTPEFEKAMRDYLAKTGTTINMGEGGTPFLDMDMGRIENLATLVDEGAAMIPALETARQAIYAGAQPGRLQEALLPLRQVMSEVGFKDENLPELELFRAASSFIVPRMRVPGSGATSDFEARMFMDATINPNRTAEANLIIAGTAIQTQRRNERLLDEQRAYIRKNKSLDGFQQYAQKKGLYEIYQRPTTRAEVEKMSRGTVFIWGDELLVRQ